MKLFVHPSWKHDSGQLGEVVRRGLELGTMVETKPMTRAEYDRQVYELFKDEKAARELEPAPKSE